jgi:phosphoribosyl 1,2-cyclic phosphodiesterase
MIALSLQSGSNGNSILVCAAGRKILFDAGISGKRAQERMAAFGHDIRDVEAVLISHDHSDHSRCAGIYHRKFGLDVWATESTYRTADRSCGLGRMSHVHHYQAGTTLVFGDGDLVVHSHSTPHDAADGVVFVVEAEGKRLGVLTDLGHTFAGLGELLASCNGVFIESNYDPAMLENGPYPWHLKQRISGPRGHISNAEAGMLLREAGGNGLRWAVLSHLSEENNRPDLALATVQRETGLLLPVSVASRYEPTGVFEL